ncbi:ABC transporter substrate-binding protein [Nonomuraea lactucae]|uniref:ABC transporter substrate-binding protein n=1 Tax=Nonomuraea lactucae TaxID=2249762 RepID=UPI001F0532FF|nr:ABC transporter substrate-binding protein [Nonomuraea lactucae]
MIKPQNQSTQGPTRREIIRRSALLSAGVAAAGVLSACGGGPATTRRPAGSTTPSSGGVLRIGTTGGSAKDSLNPHNPVTYPDQARVLNLYEPLFTRDPAYEIEPLIGESLEASKSGQVWTLRLREGVQFHNGKTVDADDVIFSLRRIIDPKDPGTGASGLAMIDPAELKKIDARTVQIGLKSPYALLKDQLAQYALGIVPVGFDVRNPVGTGPFAFESFEPGGQSSFKRFDGYWREKAYADRLVIIDFPDDNAKVNALLSNQVEAIDNLPLSQIDVVKAAGAQVLVSETGSWTPFTMRVDAKPFSDVRVRQAFRLIVDRPQLVAQALNGQGRVANDLYAPFDPAYASELPQRHQDLDQAKSLLKAAGHADLRIELVTSTGIGSGAVDAAELFAGQARGAGVTVEVRKVDSSTFYGDQYLGWTFAQDYWFTRGYLPQVADGSLPESPYNETHWADKTFISLIKQARRELDDAKRTELLKQAQKIEYDSGGHIIWGFKNQVDAYSSKVTGFVPDKNLPLSNYQFRRVSIG